MCSETEGERLCVYVGGVCICVTRVSVEFQWSSLETDGTRRRAGRDWHEQSDGLCACPAASHMLVPAQSVPPATGPVSSVECPTMRVLCVFPFICHVSSRSR